ncbi:uncharacterized protein CLUP02_12628 [Colletotrichum lupini]|uniref:Uncharacterized protein n=1 Tax=Colletotrichum lupini TaxID=145971 RepID=A0A9Q8WL03_9PEZI|nr:uncharacterized protein CLUP02_12628 [Colletotrichum lupini]UQC87126.1 hypothetical protein CLUP02_12628 [Colletotrichum lupini]
MRPITASFPHLRRIINLAQAHVRTIVGTKNQPNKQNPFPQSHETELLLPVHHVVLNPRRGISVRPPGSRINSPAAFPSTLHSPTRDYQNHPTPLFFAETFILIPPANRAESLPGIETMILWLHAADIVGKRKHGSDSQGHDLAAGSGAQLIGAAWSYWSYPAALIFHPSATWHKAALESFEMSMRVSRGPPGLYPMFTTYTEAGVKSLTLIHLLWPLDVVLADSVSHLSPSISDVLQCCSLIERLSLGMVSPPMVDMVNMEGTNARRLEEHYPMRQCTLVAEESSPIGPGKGALPLI